MYYFQPVIDISNGGVVKKKKNKKSNVASADGQKSKNTDKDSTPNCLIRWMNRIGNIFSSRHLSFYKL